MTQVAPKRQETPIAVPSQLVILSQPHIEIVQTEIAKLQIELSRKTLHCAAKLLYLFENYTSWAIEKNPEKEWFYVAISSEKTTDLVTLLNHEHGRDAVIQALSALVESGLIQRRSHWNGQVKTYSYRSGLLDLESKKKAIPVVETSIPVVDFSTDTDQRSRSMVLETNRSEPESAENFVLEEIKTVEVALANLPEDITSKKPPPIKRKLVGGDIFSAASEVVFPQKLIELGVEKNGNVLAAIQAFPQNLKGAIAHLEQCLNEGWVRNATGVFVKSLKLGQSISLAIESRLDVDVLERVCLTEMDLGKRESVLDRLVGHARLGHIQEIFALCDQYKDWGFSVTDDGTVEDVFAIKRTIASLYKDDPPRLLSWIENQINQGYKAFCDWLFCVDPELAAISHEYAA